VRIFTDVAVGLILVVVIDCVYVPRAGVILTIGVDVIGLIDSTLSVVVVRVVIDVNVIDATFKPVLLVAKLLRGVVTDCVGSLF
jgi:hypothetical protein